MKVELEVIASTSIKRKKPWPKLTWMGEIQESIVLLDTKRISILYVPSGKTQRKLTKLQQLLENVAVMTTSQNGHFLIGLLYSGEMFLWHKDTDMLKIIQGTPELSTNAGNTNQKDKPKPHICISDDGTKIMVIMKLSEIYVWELDQGEVLFAAKQNRLRGTWSLIDPDEGTSLPNVECRETSIHPVFYLHQNLGTSCSCAFVFNNGPSICISSVMLRWSDPHTIFTRGLPTYRAAWNTIKYPLSEISPLAQPLRTKGAYLTKHSHDGQILAVSVNQRSSHDNKILFVSSQTDTVVVSDLKGSGAKIRVFQNARSYWVADMEWTADDMFLIVIMKQGTLCMLTRLGDPLLIQTYGHSIEMGPKPYLPLHPLISLKKAIGSNEDGNDIEVSLSEQDIMRQRFSVSTHPIFPIILCSDGYMVTVMQLPSDITCLSVMRGLVMESSKHLRQIRDQQRLQLTLFDTLKKNGKFGKKTGQVINGRGLRRSLAVNGEMLQKVGFNKEKLKYNFEAEPEHIDLLNETNESDMTDVESNVINMDAGQVLFGDVNMNETADFSMFVNGKLEGYSVAEHIHEGQKKMMLALGLGATHSGLWTEEHEDVMNNLQHNLVRLFTAVLNCDKQVLKDLGKIGVLRKKSGKNKTLQIHFVLQVLKSVMHFAKFDTIKQHLLITLLRFSHSTIDMLLSNKDLQGKEPRNQTIHGCYVIMKFMEHVISRIYSSVPCDDLHNVEVGPGDLFDPAILCFVTRAKDQSRGPKLLKTWSAAVTEEGSEPEVSKEIKSSQCIQQDSSLARRMGLTWRLIYKNCVVQLSALQKASYKGVKEDYRQIFLLLSLIQAKIQKLGLDLPLCKKPRISIGEKLCLEGSHMHAMEAWVRQLNSVKDPMVYRSWGGRRLHAILYTFLMQENLRSAVEFIELLIRQQDLHKAVALCRQDEETKRSVLSLLQQMPTEENIQPPVHIKTKAVRSVVRSMARIMAAYFSNKALFVYPSHCPQPIPPLHLEEKIGSRVIPLLQESLSNTIGLTGLGNIWTADRTLEYLLMSGLIAEATWFAHAIGDWKTAFVISVASLQHKQMVPQIYDIAKKTLELPEALQPPALLQAHLQQAWLPKNRATDAVLIDEESDVDLMTKTLHDLLLGGTICHVDTVPWLLNGLIDRLKEAAKRFTPFVVQGMYLPAPPVYCPQPATASEEELEPEVAEEINLRREISSLIQMILVVLNASRTTLPAARWYVNKITEAIEHGKIYKLDLEESGDPDLTFLQEGFLGVPSPFQGSESDHAVSTAIQRFRDMCGIVWMLYVRDKLTLNLRQKTQLAKKKTEGDDISDSQWLKHCKTTLDWALYLLPFSKFFDAEEEICGVILSLFMELPPVAETASFLAQYFYDQDSLDPETQEKLKWICKEWSGVFIGKNKGSIKSEGYPGKAPRGRTLNMAFEDRANQIPQLMENLCKMFGHYEAFVFADGTEDSGEINVGSRPYESEMPYLKFMETFYAVSFNKEIDSEKEAGPQFKKPIISRFKEEIREKELTSLSHRAMTSLHRRQSMNSALQKKAPEVITPRSKPIALPKSPPKKYGLFRSKSFSEGVNVQSPNSRLPSTSLEKKSLSQSNLHKIGNESSENKGRSGPKKMRSPRGKSPRHEDRKMNEMKSPRKEAHEMKSYSKSDEEISEGMTDPLCEPIMQGWMLEQFEFTEKYQPLGNLLEWLSRWSNRNHRISGKANSLMRIKVHPRMVLYSLWLLENHYYHMTLENVKEFQKSLEVDSKRSLVDILGLAETPKKKHVENLNLPREGVEITVMTATGVTNQAPDTRSRSSTVNETGEPNMAQQSDKKRKKKKKSKATLCCNSGVSESQGPAVQPGEDVPLEQERRPLIRPERTRELYSPPPIVPQQYEQQYFTENDSGSRKSESSLNISTLSEDALRKTLQMTLAELHSTAKSEMRNTTESQEQFLRSQAEAQGHAPNDSVKPEDLRNIVRDELKRYMEAQNEGIMKMLDSLKENRKEQPQANGHIPRTRSANTPNEETSLGQVDKNFMVMHVQVDSSPSLDTDIEVSPLPSEEMSRFTAQDSSLKVSDLRKLPPKSPGAKDSERQQMRGVLKELKRLENDSTSQFMFPSKQGFEQPEKENIAASNFNAFVNSVPPPQPQQPTLDHQPGFQMFGQGGDYPYSRVMDVLKQVNQNLAGYSGNQGQPPRLLRLIPERDTNPPPPHSTGHLPTISSATWQTSGNHRPAPSNIPSMPLLRMDNAHTSSNLHNGYQSNYNMPPIGGDHYQPSSMPLLREPPSNAPFSNIDDNYGVPQLIPPDEIIAYEQYKLHKRTSKMKNVMDFQKWKQQQAMQKENQSVKLLKADLENFGPADERDNAKRTLRRNKKMEKLALAEKSNSLTTESDQDTLREELQLQLESQVDSPRKSNSSPRKQEVTPRRDGSTPRSVSSPRKSGTPKGSPRKSGTPTGSPRKEGVSLGVQAFGTPRTPRNKEEESEGEKEEPIDHGYAVKPGLFDEYLEHQQELGSVVDTYAEVQYKAAMGLKEKPPTQTAKYDVAVETDETGPDPVKAAIEDYIRKTRGGKASLLAPDVFMGLRFAGDNKDSDPGSSDNQGRSYINVVDIGSEMLDDIKSTIPVKEKMDEDKPDLVDMKGRPVRQKLTKDKSPVRKRVGIDEAETSPGDVKREPDAVTAYLLGDVDNKGFTVPSEEELHSGLKNRTKASIRKKFTDMNAQFDAIHTMSKTIEHDFRNTKLMLDTIEQIGESIYPTGDSPDDESEEISEEGSPLKPSYVKASRSGQSIKSSPRKSKSREAELDLSGVSDIIGEALVKGDISATTLGISEQQAKRLEDRAKHASESPVEIPSDPSQLDDKELNEVFMKLSPRLRKQDSVKRDTAEMRKWTEQKRNEQTQIYMKHVNELRADEVHPFHAHGKMNTTSLSKLEQDRIDKKREREMEDIEKRKAMASQLMTDILGDKLAIESPPKTKKLQSTKQVGQKQYQPYSQKDVEKAGVTGRTRGGVQTPRKVAPLSSRRQTADFRQNQTRVLDRDLMEGDYADYQQYLYDADEQIQPSPRPVPSPRRHAPGKQGVKSHAQNQPFAQSKKGYAGMVKLQRPESTRARKKYQPKPVPYVERLAQVKPDTNSNRGLPKSLQDQQRLYGTKRLPGTFKKTQRKAPRTVKTYAQRLQEMRQTANPYGTSVRPGSANRMREVTRQGIKPKPKPRKTLTYAEQLQQLQPERDDVRPSSSTVTVQPAVGRKWQKPKHQAKTYAEQLQELQKPSSKTYKAAYAPAETKVYKSPPLRSAFRSRPYGDPYQHLDDEDLSELSPWSVNEDIRKMIYNDASQASDSHWNDRTAASEYDISELEMDDYPYDEYTDMVNVDQLLDAASIASSRDEINWDEIQKLIADA